MKSKLLLSLLIVSLLPAQLCAMATVVAKLKHNNTGNSITLIGYLSDIAGSGAPPAIVDRSKQIAKQQQNELITYLNGKQNVQLILDEKTIQPLLNAHALNHRMIEDDIKHTEFLRVHLPIQGLEFFTLDHYQTLLRKCAKLQAEMTTVDKVTQENFANLYNELKNQESLLRSFQNQRAHDIKSSDMEAYETLMWNLRSTQIALTQYASVIPLLTAGAQHNAYAYITLSHIYNPFEGGSIINYLRAAGYNVVFYKNVFTEIRQESDETEDEDEHADLRSLQQITLDLTDVLTNADRV